MPKDTQISVFEITGNEIVGGDSPEHNQRFFDRINVVETHALKIGRSLGMSEVTLGVSHSEMDTIGFRFAESSNDRFDLKGVQITDEVSSQDMIRRLR